jgi:GTP cyclohydrolase I
MLSKEPEIVARIKEALLQEGLETPIVTPMHENVENAIEDRWIGILTMLGLDVVGDDSLQETPRRVAKMFTQEIFYGLNYANFPKIGKFENKYKCNEMVSVKCSVKSVCEHHFQPIIGIAYIAYIPSTKVLGLSKFHRVTDFFCRRPQVQERLTAQIHRALQIILESTDVAVVVKARHMCVELRGIQDHHSETITSKISGKFFDVAPLRQEFLALTR